MARTQKEFKWAHILTGGASGALDAINGNNLIDLDAHIVMTQTGGYLYSLDDDAGGSESSPSTIAPDTNAGDIRHLLQGLTFPNTGLKILETSGANTLTLKWNETDTADRILSLLVSGGNRSLTLNENLTIGGGNDGTITFSVASKILTIDESETTSNYHTDARGDARYYTQTQLVNQTAGSEGSKLIGFHSHTLHDHLLHITNKGVMGGCVVSDAGTLNITWTSGVVWDSANEITMTIASGSGTCTNNAVNYLVADYSTSTTVLQLGTTFPTDADMVLVAIIWCQDNDIWQIEHSDWLNLMLADMHTSLMALEPGRVISGMGVSEDENIDNALDVTMASGILYLGGHHRVTVSQVDTRTTALVRHFHASSAWDSEVNAEIDTAWYDNGANKTDATTGKWLKAVFLYSDGKLHWVYPTVQYTTRAQANAGPIPATPPGLARAAKLTAIVYKVDAANFTATDWIDIRVGLAEAIASAPVTDHGYLDGLDNNDHGAIYYTETEINTWRNSVTQTEMGYVNGITSDIQTQLNALVGAHAMLDGSVHNDSVADAVTRGSIIYGSAVPKWDELVKGAANTFLGSDGTDISYRTAAQVLASLSGAATATFDFGGQALTGVGAVGCGTVTIANGSSISLQEDIAFTGATTENQIKFPNSLANALSFQEGSNIYLKFLTDDPAVSFRKNVGIHITIAPLARLHILQYGPSATMPVLMLDQDDVSEGFIDFLGSDRGVIDESTSSLESVRVEINGVVRRLALYADA